MSALILRGSPRTKVLKLGIVAPQTRNAAFPLLRGGPEDGDNMIRIIALLAGMQELQHCLLQHLGNVGSPTETSAYLLHFKTLNKCSWNPFPGCDWETRSQLYFFNILESLAKCSTELLGVGGASQMVVLYLVSIVCSGDICSGKNLVHKGFCPFSNLSNKGKVES